MGAVAFLTLLSACGGGTNTGTRVAVTPTPHPEATATPPTDLARSCDSIQDVASFRYTIRLKLDLPGLPTPPGAVDGGLVEPTADPFDALAGILLGLFSDLQVEGAFVAPDRTRAVLHVGGQEVEVRTIDGRSWVRLGDVWQEETAPTEIAFLSPQTLCGEIVPDLGEALAGAPWSPETLDGVATRHYHLDEADSPQLGGLLGTENDTDLPAESQVNIWLAQEGGWPVRFQIEASGRDDQGRPVDVELFFGLRDINSPDIEVAPPEVTGGQA
jgi:hypothetical protein